MEIFATVISADVELQYVSSYRTILSKIEKFKLYTLPFIEPCFEQVCVDLWFALLGTGQPIFSPPVLKRLGHLPNIGIDRLTLCRGHFSPSFNDGAP